MASAATVAAVAVLATVAVPVTGADSRLEPVVLTLVAAGLATMAGLAGARRLLRALAVLAVVGAGIALPASPVAGRLDAAEAGVCLAIAALGVVVLTGWAGQLFLAPLALTGAAAGATAWLAADLGQPLAASIAGALALTGVLALLAGAVCAAQASQTAVAVLSLGLAEALDAVSGGGHAPLAGRRPPVTAPGHVRLGGLLLDGGAARWYALLLLLGVCLLAVAVLAGRRLRPALQAASNQRAAAVRGVDVVAVRRGAHLAAGLLAAVAGCALATVPGAVPARVLDPAASLRLIGLVVVLGRSRPGSAVLAGLVCGAVPSLAVPPAWLDLAIGAAIVARLRADELRRRPHKSPHALIGCAAASAARSVTASRRTPARLGTMSRDAD